MKTRPSPPATIRGGEETALASTPTPATMGGDARGIWQDRQSESSQWFEAEVDTNTLQPEPTANK